MTRDEIINDYDVNADGVIKSPGKFEGEMLYVPYFWEKGLDGCADLDIGRVYGFEISGEDVEIFPELKGDKALLLEESEQGFVYSQTRDSIPDESEYLLDDDSEANDYGD